MRFCSSSAWYKCTIMVFITFNRIKIRIQPIGAITSARAAFQSPDELNATNREKQKNQLH